MITTPVGDGVYASAVLSQVVASFQSQWTKLEAAPEGTFNHKLFKCVLDIQTNKQHFFVGYKQPLASAAPAEHTAAACFLLQGRTLPLEKAAISAPCIFQTIHLCFKKLSHIYCMLSAGLVSMFCPRLIHLRASSRRCLSRPTALSLSTR
jgi:hypothetical protein